MKKTVITTIIIATIVAVSGAVLASGGKDSKGCNKTDCKDTLPYREQRQHIRN